MPQACHIAIAPVQPPNASPPRVHADPHASRERHSLLHIDIHRQVRLYYAYVALSNLSMISVVPDISDV